MDRRKLAAQRFLKLIEQFREYDKNGVERSRPLSERAASKAAGVDDTLSQKVRAGTRSFGMGAQDAVSATLGLREEWWTDPDIDDSNFVAFIGAAKAPRVPPAPQALREYAARHQLSIEAAAAHLVGVASAIEKAGGYHPGSRPVTSLDEAAPRPKRP